MGTSGDRNGYKVFSINTTIRNPKRNTDFLTFFKPYDGQVFSETVAHQYFFDLVANGVYRLTDIPQSVKNKIDNGEKLTDQEASQAIKDNPQATGLYGRVMTQLRAMKDQGFLMFEPQKRGKNKISLTSLGKQLIDGKIDATIVYTKAMIGMHANSPIRTTLYNQSRPFLNTLFVINEVKREWEKLGFEAKGILRHEFAAFVLSMKDCDYHSTAQEIIEYRKKFKYEFNRTYLIDYLNNKGILPLADNSIFHDYPDDVFRKFEMTGLIIKRGTFAYTYYDFSTYNIEKIESILREYNDYKFKEFATQNDYYDYLGSISIPWQKSEIVRRKIIESKAKILKIVPDSSQTLDEQEFLLDRVFYSHALDKAVKKYNTSFVNKELLILSGTIREKSKLDDISEPLRLEYLLALLLGIKYGTNGLVSNIIYNEDGAPLHFAPSGKCDIIYYSEDGSFILEPTMLRGRSQVLNSETTNVARHVKTEMKETGLTYRAMMIAPYVHSDVTSYFQFTISKNEVQIAPINIDRAVGLFHDSSDICSLGNNFDKIVDELKQLDEISYSDNMNSYEVNKEALN